MATPQLQLKVLNGEFTIHRLPANSKIPGSVYESDFFTLSKTDDEVSIICPTSITLQSEKSEPGWSCLQVLGPLEFSLTGVLAKIASVLADSNISIFAISTYDTDYIFVDSKKLI